MLTAPNDSTDLLFEPAPVAIPVPATRVPPPPHEAGVNPDPADPQPTAARDRWALPNGDLEGWELDPVDSVDEVIERTEATLAFIAEASVAARDVVPRDHYALSIIVPVYNERHTIGEVLARIDDVMPRSTQVIIVDDGSTDGTSEWLAGLTPRAHRTVIRRRRNHGKGSAIRLAIRHSRGSVVAIQDADLEYDPALLLRAIWPILDGNADVVYGSRYMAGGNDMSLVHRWGNRFLTTLSNLTTGLRLTDMETCHKAFDGEMLRNISLRESRFGFEPEITAKIAARNVRVLEVPTSYDPRGYDEGKKIGWRDALAAVVCMWIYRNG